MPNRVLFQASQTSAQPQALKFPTSPGRFLLLCGLVLQFCGGALAGPPSVEDLFRPPSFHNVGVSPSGRFVSYLVETNQQPAIHIIELATRKEIVLGGKTMYFGSTENYFIIDHCWIDEETIVYPVRRALWYFYNLTAYHIGRQRATLIARQDNPMIVWDPLPHIPEVFIAQSLFRTGNAQNVFRVDTRRGSFRPVAKNPGHIVSWTADQTGTMRLGVSFEGKERFLLHRPADGRPWSRLPDTGSAVPLIFDAAGQTFLAFSTFDGFCGLGVYDLAQERFLDGPIRDPRFDLDSVRPIFRVVDGRSVLSGIEYATEKYRTLWLDPELRTIMASVNSALPDRQNSFIGLNEAESLAIFSSFSDVEPKSIMVFDLKEGKIQRLRSSRPWLGADMLSPMAPISIPASDGSHLPGYLTRPRHGGDGPYPTVVLIHGGPMARDFWGFDPEVQFYASLGFAVLQVNYRGSSGYGRAHGLYDSISAVCAQAPIDLKDAVEWGVAEGVIDRQRVALVGFSYGAYLAVATAARFPDLPRCVIASGGVYDWAELLRADQRDRYPWVDFAYSDFLADPALLQQHSVLEAASRIRVPVWLIHGSDDKRVESNQSRRLGEVLKRAGVRHRLTTYKWVGHKTPDGEEKIAHFRAIGEFLLNPDSL